MQFKDSKTYVNLARSFAGESQAGMRYQLIAKLAEAEGYAVLAENIRTVAKNETYHAKSFFNALLQKAGSCANIDLNAGYPFHFGTLEENLAFAEEDERAESQDIYPAFAADAEAEGFADIAALFKRVAGVEREHGIVFGYLCGALREGTLYKRDKPTLWVCAECGYRATANEAWQVCPLCGSGRGHVEIRLPFDTK